MSTDPFGPVELFVLSFPQRSLPNGFRSALLDTLARGSVTLLDLVAFRRLADGGLEIAELDAVGEELELSTLQVTAQGLIGDEDLEQLSVELADDGLMLAIAIEHTWARQVIGSVLDAQATVVATERIPADVVNEVAALAASPADVAQ